MSHSTAQSQAANAGRGNDSTWGCEPKHVCCVIDIAPGASAANGGSPRRRIDARVFYPAKVDDQSVVANSHAACVMTAAADCHEQIVCSREVHGANDVRHVRATGDQPRLFVDHSVVYLAGLIVILITWFDQSASKVCLEISDGILVKHDEVSAKQPYGQDNEVPAF